MLCANSPQGVKSALADASACRNLGGYPPDELAGLRYLTAAGSQHAFELLYWRSRGRLFGVILRINHDHGEAEEVLQETYLKVWLHCQRFEASMRTCHWLFSQHRPQQCH